MFPALCLLLGSLAGSTACADPLGKYRLILDRELFGSAPASPETPAPPPVETPAEPGWAREYKMTMMTIDQETHRVRVGLQNVRGESAVLLIEGRDTHPEFSLRSADFERGLATVTRHGSPHQFSLATAPEPGDNPIVHRPESSPRRMASSNRTRDRSEPRRRIIRRIGEGNPDVDEETSELEAPRTTRFRNNEELQEHLKEVQMDALRSGKPPLPIPLTQEMDDQLVREGVLPPQNEE